MRCHFITDEIAGKVLILGCGSAANHNDIDFCTCRTYSYHDFEKENFRQAIEDKDEEIAHLQSEVSRLNKIIHQHPELTDFKG